jgi:putative sigma-54 modulation protein
MDMTFTGRGLHVTDSIRRMAEHKLTPLARIEPRGGLKRVEASLRIPRKTFRAHAEADDVPAAIDLVRDKLERQLRDHHGKKRPLHRKGALGYAETEARSEP